MYGSMQLTTASPKEPPMDAAEENSSGWARMPLSGSAPAAAKTSV